VPNAVITYVMVYFVILEPVFNIGDTDCVISDGEYDFKETWAQYFPLGYIGVDFLVQNSFRWFSILLEFTVFSYNLQKNSVACKVWLIFISSQIIIHNNALIYFVVLDNQCR
jgi:hypothetical protein